MVVKSALSGAMIFYKSMVNKLSILQEWQITTLSFEEDPEPFGKERDAAITALAQEAGVDVVVRTSHTLYKLQK